MRVVLYEVAQNLHTRLEVLSGSGYNRNFIAAEYCTGFAGDMRYL